MFLNHNCSSLWGGAVEKKLPANARDVGSIPGSESSTGVGNSNSLQYSCLENSMDRETQCAIYMNLVSMGSQRVGYDWAQHRSSSRTVTIKKFENISLIRMWANGHSHTLVIVLYLDTASVESNLAIVKNYKYAHLLIQKFLF